MTAEVWRTFFSVARCPNVARCLETTEPNSCREIVESQSAASYATFQLPEPWVGQIDVAKILFVGSNPSIGPDDHAPGSASDEQIWESRHLAFGGGARQYILDGIRATLPNGARGDMVAYWKSIRALARELIPSAAPGLDYAITEVVHCKSKSQKGVERAYNECTNRHFQSVMTVAPARVVIALGKYAWRYFLGKGVEPPPAPVQIGSGGRARILLFLAHPSSFEKGPRSIGGRYPNDLPAMQKLLARGGT
jgi:uracil-DNA glycosylase